MEVKAFILGLLLTFSDAVCGLSYSSLNVTSTQQVKTTLDSNQTTQLNSTSPTLKGCHTKINGTWVKLDLKHQLLAKQCSETSIPMGVGSGVLIFFVVMIIVTKLMKRESEKNEKIAIIKSRDIEAVSPLPSRCASLLLLPQEVLIEPLQEKALQANNYITDETADTILSQDVVDSKLQSADDHEFTNGNNPSHTESLKV